MTSETLVGTIMVILFLNAFVSFCYAFFRQAQVILKVSEISNQETIYGIGEKNSRNTNFGKFMNGEFYPELKRKWAVAWTWCVYSWIALFAIGFALNNFFG